jgi:hypothetical protein
LFSNYLRLPTDELALKLEQLLRTPGLHNLLRELEAVGVGRFSERQQLPTDFGRSKAWRAVVKELSHVLL